MGSFEPVNIGHRQIENHDIGPQRLKLLYSRESVFGFSADRPVTRLEDRANHAARYL